MDAGQSIRSGNQHLQSAEIKNKTGRVIVTGVSHIKEIFSDEIWQIMRGGRILVEPYG